MPAGAPTYSSVSSISASGALRLTLRVPRRALRSLAYPSPEVATMFEFRWTIDGIVGYRLTLRGRETATVE